MEAFQPTDPEVVAMETHTPRELAAAVRAVPHDARVIITHHRASGAPLHIRFDYRNVMGPRDVRGIRGRDRREGLDVFADEAIDARLEGIAKRILSRKFKGAYE